MNNSIKPTNNSTPTFQVGNTSGTQNTSYQKHSHRSFIHTIIRIIPLPARIKNFFVSPPKSFNNPAYNPYQEGNSRNVEANKSDIPKTTSSTTALMHAEKKLFTEFESMLKDCPAPDSQEISEFNALKGDWAVINSHLSSSSHSLSNDYQSALLFFTPKIEDQPIFLQKMIPTVCKILDKQEIYNKTIDKQEACSKTIDDLAPLISFHTYSSTTPNREKFLQQDNSNLDYIKHIITTEYNKHQERMTEISQAYTSNRNIIEEDANLSQEQRVILYKINYLVANLMSDPQLLQTEGLLRKSSGVSQAIALVNSIPPKNLDVLTFESNQQPPHRIISAIKMLRENFLTQSDSEKQKMLGQFNDFKNSGLTKSLAELDHLTRICIPLYKEIIRNEKINKMSIKNVAQLEGELYKHVCSTDPKDPLGNAWRATAAKLVTAMINPNSLLAE